jgi:hypothetical protein
MHVTSACQRGWGLDRTRTRAQGNGLHKGVMAGGSGRMMHNKIGSPERESTHLACCCQWLDKGVHESLGCNMPQPGAGVGPSSACDGLMMARVQSRSAHDELSDVTSTKHTMLCLNMQTLGVGPAPRCLQVRSRGEISYLQISRLAECY